MLNKKDPLIDAIQQVMQSNQADRDAVKAVNEKFGIQDRRVLPRERQGEWDAAYKTVLTEGVEALEEKLSSAQKHHMDVDDDNDIDSKDLKMKRMGMKEEGDPSKAIPGDTVTGGSSVTTVKPKTQAPAEPRPVGQADQSRLKTMIQNIKEAKKAAMCEGGMEKTMGEFKRGKLHSGSKTGPIVKNRDQAIAIGMNNEETVNRTGQGNLPAGVKIPAQQTVNRPDKGNLQQPQTVNSVDKGSPQGTLTRGLTVGTTPQDMQRGAEQDKVGMKRPSAVAPMGAGAAGQQVGKPLPAKPPTPRLRPADAAKVKAIRKQPNAGAAQRQGVAAKPAKKLTPLQQQMKRSRYNRDGGNVGPGSS